ncbi:CapA family protein [Kocuria sp.]|uniref:CapA family protein n=1 Tax=Kocuria sp. TaxID=1871328 RepID=UPI0026DFD449|nr:CapA family protein [Kocuria sp.]MDO5368358.1 CapA family protein [Kocuria sp.]
MSLPTSRYFKTLTLAAGVTLTVGSLAGCAESSDESAVQSPGASGTEAAAQTGRVPSPAESGPDCPEDACFTVAMTGDLLLHEGLWSDFAVDPANNDGKNFDFDPLLAGQKPYLEQSDVAICELETPVAPRGGPYADYPSFNVPPEIIAAAKNTGYDACTAATNHTVDQGTEGVNRTIASLEDADLKHTGSYSSAEASEEPMLLETPAGTVAVVTGTNSLNGQQAEYDWQVDRLRDPAEDPQAAQRDIDHAVAQSEKAREQGADVVIAAMHSIMEYQDTTDVYQTTTAHALVDSGAFDAVYGHGSHSVQPIENYKGKWIVYGLGNTVSETSTAYETNNQGLITRFQFARGNDGEWDVSDLSWAPSSNTQGGRYAWCSAASDAPNGTCRSQAEDAQNRERIARIVNTPSAVEHGLREWLVSEDRPAVS